MLALSLVLSLTSALLGTSVQQWVSRYIELPHIPSSLSARARVRSFLFLGTLNFGMQHAVETVPTLLHLSVFLFLIGLVILFFTLHKTVAIFLSNLVGLLGMVYLTLSILPCVYRNCPYGTPVSSILWRLWHSFASLLAFCLRSMIWILKGFHALLGPYNLGAESPRERKLAQWSEIIENSLDEHRKFLKDGFRLSIVQGALDAPVVVDLKALVWLLDQPAMAEQSNFQEFIVNTAGDTIVHLMNVSNEFERNVFRDHLLELLRSCAPDAPELNEGVRRRRLLVCLSAILRIVKTSGDGISPSESVLRDMRTNFANIGLMQALWADTDPYIRVISRSICAFLMRHLVHKHLLEESERAWLQDVTGRSTNTISLSLDNLLEDDLMNLDFYVYGVLEHQKVDLPVEVATLFLEIVAILANAGSQAFRRSVLEVVISPLMQRAEEQEDRLRREVIRSLRRVLEIVFPSAATKPLRISSNLNRQGDGDGTPDN